MLKFCLNFNNLLWHIIAKNLNFLLFYVNLAEFS